MIVITQPDTPPSAPEQMPASSFNIQAPYAPGSPDPIVGAARDDVAGSVEAAQAAAEARYQSHQSDTYGLGSQIGDSMTLPSQDFSVATAHEIGYHGEVNE